LEACNRGIWNHFNNVRCDGTRGARDYERHRFCAIVALELARVLENQQDGAKAVTFGESVHAP
jgi:hypothetical protein